MLNQAVKTIIFDLDGTIYQDNSFHQDYIHFMLEGSKWEDWKAALIHFVEQVLSGKKLSMNQFYAVKQANPNAPEELFSTIEQRCCPSLSYPEALERQGILYLGDLWALMTLIGETLGLLKDERRDAIYRKTRKHMEAKGMRGNTSLQNAISELVKYYRVILVSNSYEETALEFLAQLGYDGLFPTIISSANKPYEFIEKLEELQPCIFEHPETVISIGDHAYNDLMPIQAKGGYTIWLNPFQNVFRPNYDQELNTLEDLTEYLQILIERAKATS